MRTATPEELARVVESKLEDTDTPAAILAILKTKEGKKLDKRVIDKLNAELPGLNIRKGLVASMTKIIYGDYYQTDGAKGGNLLIGYDSDTIDTNWILEKNPAYFRAALQRNSERRAFLADPLSHQMICQELEKIEALQREIQCCKAAINLYMKDNGAARSDLREILD